MSPRGLVPTALPKGVGQAFGEQLLRSASTLLRETHYNPIQSPNGLLQKGLPKGRVTPERVTQRSGNPFGSNLSGFEYMHTPFLGMRNPVESSNPRAHTEYMHDRRPKNDLFETVREQPGPPTGTHQCTRDQTIWELGPGISVSPLRQ